MHNALGYWYNKSRMQYDYRRGAKKQKGRKWLVLPFVGLLGGLYLLVLVFAPALPFSTSQPDVTAKKLVVSEPVIGENRVYVPKINVDVPIAPIGKSEALALEKGAVNRASGNGNPRDGGNYVLAAHRFNLGLTPEQTRAKSPFYHVNKLVAGDQIYVDYSGVRYAYEVKERKSVSPTALEIEERTPEDILTMYTCELSGPAAGREVVIAKPIGKVVWTNGSPKLKTL